MTVVTDAHDEAAATVRLSQRSKTGTAAKAETRPAETGRPGRLESATARRPDPAKPSPLDDYERKPVEFWPTAGIRLAIQAGDLSIWRDIVSAIKRDPYGRTARQVEEVLETTTSQGITTALGEVLDRARSLLHDDERAEVGRQLRGLLERSGLGHREFASRAGLSPDELTACIDGTADPSAAQMVRMQRLADRFAKMRAQRQSGPS